MPEVEGIDVPFDEAIEHFRNKVRLPTDSWTDLWQGQHARGFVVAGGRRDDMLADFQRAIQGALDDGTTLRAFRGDFDKIVEQYGWSYKGGRNWRSRVIFETNLRTSYEAGRWQQMERIAERRPWLRYTAVDDAATRPEHLAWHGTILRYDDPWWDTHAPPNGWGCRCSFDQLSDDDLERWGLKPSASAPSSPMVTRTINTPDGPVDILVPEGIDPGWSYNVGKAGAGIGADLLAQERHGPWQPLTAPGGSVPKKPGRIKPVGAAALGPEVEGEAALRKALRDAIGGDKAVFADPLDSRVEANQSLVDHMLASTGRQRGREAYWPLIPSLIEDPTEIWAGFETNPNGRVRLRRRYVKRFAGGAAGDVGLIVDVDGGRWSGLTVARGRKAAGMAGMRSGVRLYRKAGIPWYSGVPQGQRLQVLDEDQLRLMWRILKEEAQRL